MTYLRKAWVPPTCERCGKPARPYQSTTPLWSGSLPWNRGTHFDCLLKETYDTAFIRDQLEQPSAVVDYMRRHDAAWRGGTITVPFTKSKP